MNFCFYNDEGKITSILVADSEEVAGMQGGSYLVCHPQVTDATHYVWSGRVVEKRPYTYNLVSEGLLVSLSGLPSGVRVSTMQSSVLSDGGATDIEFELPGTYMIELSGLVEYIDETLEVAVG